MELVDFLKAPENRIPDWLFNSLGLRNPRKAESLKPFYDFLQTEAMRIPGDIAEFGVYRGDSLLTSGLLLTRMGSNKKAYGFDTFSGFPPLHEKDEPKKFDELFRAGKITADHWKAIQFLRQAEGSGFYKQHSFQGTSLELVQQRIAAFGLKNIVLMPGEFGDSFRKMSPDVTYAACLMDCDLYVSHKEALAHCWERLAPGGFIYLDEYYSLKYPGARIAIDEFCASAGISPERVLGYTEPGEFERWYLRKPGKK